MKLSIILMLTMLISTNYALAAKTFYILIQEDDYYSEQNKNLYRNVFSINVDKKLISGKNVEAFIETDLFTYSLILKSCNSRGCAVEIKTKRKSTGQESITGDLYNYREHDSFYNALFSKDKSSISSSYIVMSVDKYRSFLSFQNEQRSFYGYPPVDLPSKKRWTPFGKYPDGTKRNKFYYYEVAIQGGYIDPKDF